MAPSGSKDFVKTVDRVPMVESGQLAMPTKKHVLSEIQPYQLTDLFYSKMEQTVPLYGCSKDMKKAKEESEQARLKFIKDMDAMRNDRDHLAMCQIRLNDTLAEILAKTASNWNSEVVPT